MLPCSQQGVHSRCLGHPPELPATRHCLPLSPAAARSRRPARPPACTSPAAPARALAHHVAVEGVEDALVGQLRVGGAGGGVGGEWAGGKERCGAELASDGSPQPTGGRCAPRHCNAAATTSRILTAPHLHAVVRCTHTRSASHSPRTKQPPCVHRRVVPHLQAVVQHAHVLGLLDADGVAVGLRGGGRRGGAEGGGR